MTHALACLLCIVPQADPPTAQDPDRVRAVLVRTTDDLLLDQRRFAQGLSLSGLVGVPVCMLVEAELTELQRDLLRRLPGAELVCIGDPPAGFVDDRKIRLAREPHELYEPAAAAVVTSMHLFDQFEAAAEACRLRLPLLVADDGLADRIKRLGTKRVHRVAARIGMMLPPGVEEVADLSKPAQRLAAQKGTEEPYFALANYGAARAYGSGAPLGAAALAAAHGGVLHVLNQKVEFDYATLQERAPPEELEDHKAGKWLIGAFDLGDGEILLAVPRVTFGPGLGSIVPQWGDPIVDLNGDGRLDAATESIPVGSVHRFGERDWSVSLRLIGALGMTKFHDGQRTQRAIRITPAAETIAEGLAQIYAEAGVMPRSLLIAGDHREVPFDYIKDPVYAKTIMHEQELASDNLYGDPDGDGYLDIAVGRFVASGHVQATTLAARLATHGLWRHPAKPIATMIYPAWADDELELQIPMIFPPFEALMAGAGLDFTRSGYETRLHLREDGDLEQVLPSLPSSSVIAFAHHSGPDAWQFRVQKLDGKIKADLLVPRGRVEQKARGTGVPFLAGAPLIVGAGCDSAGLDYEVVFKNSIVHTFFEQGAIGYVGNTRAGFPDTEEFLVRQMLQAALGMQPGTAGPMSIGEAFRQGKNYLDLLIRERGPFRSVYPFVDYDLPMRREWHSLVYYGDPALRLPRAAEGPTVPAKVFEGGAASIELTCDVPLVPMSLWFMEIVAVGPLREVSALLAPGLSYSSVPWATHADTAKPAIVGPGVFLDVEIPPAVTGNEVTLKDGPEWAMGGSRIVTDARGDRRLLLSVDLVRYAMQEPEAVERADKVVIGIK